MKEERPCSVFIPNERYQICNLRAIVQLFSDDYTFQAANL